MLLRLRAYENFANKLPYDDEIFQKFKMVRTKAINNKYRLLTLSLHLLLLYHLSKD